jgi:hypothetical protein
MRDEEGEQDEEPEDTDEPTVAKRYFVGTVALFGAGIRSEAHHHFTPAHFTFAINGAIRAALKRLRDRLPVTFVPRGLLIQDGQDALSRPQVASPVRIGQMSIQVEEEKPK